MRDDFGFCCQSTKMRAVRDLVRKVAGTDATVLIRGETGVGKELVARAIHAASPRASRPHLKINCAALPEELLESELFGHEKGAFTGAHRQKPGRFELAQHGTLLLDEIGELPSSVQAKLLHVLQDGTFTRIGGVSPITSDVRLIAATNRDLEAAMQSGDFREDLYYRLNVIEVTVPPLRERPEDLSALLDYFLRIFNAQHGCSVAVTPAMRKALLAYAWPGNVRELENLVKRLVVLGGSQSALDEIAAILERTPRLGSRAESAAAAAASELPGGLREVARRAARDAERAAIKDVLERVHWNRIKAARLLQISYKALLYKIAQCGLATEEAEEQAVS